MPDSFFARIIKKNFRTFRNRMHRRMYINPNEERQIVDRFHILYYDAHKYGKTWGDTYWMGVKTLKCPLDMWLYQEILFTLRPDVIIECGTANGGSALFFASMFDLLGNGRIISIDVEERPNRPAHDRIKYILGSSIDKSIVDMVRSQIKPEEKVMVVLDSNHKKEHVLAELRTYHSFVSPGYYMVVEDSNLNGHPVNPDFGPGPMEALEEFLKENRDFSIDPDCEKFLMTFNPRGFLKKRV
jgi:cephalosporin hydroxylase